ncbi:MAG TPA: hypothetical protein VEB64_18160 [Azospirillaceae bacterium]|nr:hypothetical protein [Azospirillaceae bacterium]
MSARLTLLVLAGTLALGACGKKPDFVDPPPGVSPSAFPRIYPNPRVDLRPSLKETERESADDTPATPDADQPPEILRTPVPGDPLGRTLDDFITPGNTQSLP